MENIDRVFGIFFIEDFFGELKICVKFFQVFLCNLEIYFFFINKYLLLVLLDKKLNGNEIRICEFVGVVRFNKVDIEVFGCCQMELKLKLEIDKICVFLKLGFEGYKIGYLYFVIIVIIIVDYIVKKLNVKLICSQKNE